MACDTRAPSALAPWPRTRSLLRPVTFELPSSSPDVVYRLPGHLERRLFDKPAKSLLARAPAAAAAPNPASSSGKSSWTGKPSPTEPRWQERRKLPCSALPAGSGHGKEKGGAPAPKPALKSAVAASTGITITTTTTTTTSSSSSPSSSFPPHAKRFSAAKDQKHVNFLRRVDVQVFDAEEPAEDVQRRKETRWTLKNAAPAPGGDDPRRRWRARPRAFHERPGGE